MIRGRKRRLNKGKREAAKTMCYLCEDKRILDRVKTDKREYMLGLLMKYQAPGVNQ